MKTTWVIIGATSIIAQEFAHIAARNGHPLWLVGRAAPELAILCSDYTLRYKVACTPIICNLESDIALLVALINSSPEECALFIAAANIIENNQLTHENIQTMLQVNIISLSQLIHAYMHKQQAAHRLIFLSSVAAGRGRAKNSLYGASKAAIDCFLEGLQQSTNKNNHITQVICGFIDTQQTFAKPGIFGVSSPKSCALACWKASYHNKQRIYHPYFWRYIMGVILCIPFSIYRKLAF